MAKKPYSITYIRPGWPKELVVKRFKTEQKAVDFLTILEVKHGDGDVEIGAYSLIPPADDVG